MRRPVFPSLFAATAWLTASRRANFAATIVAVLLFAGVFALRLAIDVEGDPEAHLFVLPIALVALAMGRYAGLAGGIIGLALFLAVHEGAEYDLDAWTVISRAVVFIALGGGLGYYVDRGRRAGGELREAESGYRDLLGRLYRD